MAECGWQKGVSRWGAPFAFWLLVLFSGPALAGSTLCGSERRDEQATVGYVYDGDTLRLEDGRKVRVIGINTPELGKDGAPDEPFAKAARDATRTLAGRGSRIGLRIGSERRDRYGRLLAHVYLPGGSSLGAELLARGLATTLVIPPNTSSIECYAQVEAQARDHGKGIWGLARYRPVSSASLKKADGYRLVRGRVTRVGESRSSVWLNLEGSVALRIRRQDLDQFTTFDPRKLMGREVLARGWLHRRHGELRMTVRHPAALAILD